MTVWSITSDFVGWEALSALLSVQEGSWINVINEYMPGIDVMINIFSDFRQFSAKKMAFFSKTNVMIKFLHNLAFF
jgi:hypothetical protein